MRTVVIIFGGLLLLGLCVVTGRYTGDASPSTSARLALYFIPIWLIVAAANMWVGVSRAGYSVAEELPIFLAIFATPAAAAVFVWWKFSRG